MTGRASIDTLASAALSLLLAFMIWLVASDASSPMRDVTLPVGSEGYAVEFVGVPEGWVVYSPGSTTVALSARSFLAPRELAEVTEPARVFIDVSELTPSESSIVEPVSWTCEGCARSGVRIEGADPERISVRFDPIVTETRRVVVELPSGLDDEAITVRRRSAEPSQVLARGARRDVARVRRVVAPIDELGVGEERGVQVVRAQAVDAGGAIVEGVALDPPTVTVEVDLGQPGTRLPVEPIVRGEVPEGYWLTGMTYEPNEVAVVGPPEALEELIARGKVSTEVIDISSFIDDEVVSVALVLPEGVEDVSLPTGVVTVTMRVRAQPSSKAFDLVVEAEGLEEGLSVQSSPETVTALMNGPQPVLTALDASDLRALVDVAGLEPGRHRLPVRIEGPSDLETLSITPEIVEVTIALVEGAGAEGAAGVGGQGGTGPAGSAP